MSNYENRMEQSDRAAATLVTPRSGYEFDDPDGLIRRGVAVRSDHLCVVKNRGAFILATGGSHPHASVRRESPQTAEAVTPAVAAPSHLSETDDEG